MSTPVEQIKARLGIVDVVGSYIKLERGGSTLRARCPFHNEKTPSFHVSPTREGYHCFGCNKGGDIFTFVQEIEGVDFSEALKILATRAGVELKREDPRVRSERERLFAIIEDAAQFFEKALQKNISAQEYIRSRGITEESVQKFRIGFAPADWRALYAFLREKKYLDGEMEKAGLVIKGTRPGPNGEAYFDRFRSRIMFPLFNTSGAVVGFSGRIFGDAPPDTAKYMNSPQTPLYDKSQILYGYDKAKNSIREKDACVLVEGQMDIVMSHQAGVTNTVAVSGTALTEHHLGLVHRLTKNLVVAFDPDSAGMNAAARGVDMALGLGMDVRAAGLPDGLDPADLVRKDPAAWVLAVEKAEHIILFFLGHLKRQKLDERTLRTEVAKKVLPYIARLKSPMEQAHFISEVADAVGLPEEPLRDEVRNYIKGLSQASPSRARPPAQIAKETRSRKDQIQDRLLGIIAWQEAQGEKQMDLERVTARARDIIGDSFELLRASFGEENTKGVFEAEAMYGNSPQVVPSAADELLLALEEELLREERDKILKRWKAAEAVGDEKGVDENMHLYQDIDLRLAKLKDTH